MTVGNLRHIWRYASSRQTEMTALFLSDYLHMLQHDSYKCCLCGATVTCLQWHIGRCVNTTGAGMCPAGQNDGSSLDFMRIGSGPAASQLLSDHLHIIRHDRLDSSPDLDFADHCMARITYVDLLAANRKHINKSFQQASHKGVSTCG